MQETRTISKFYWSAIVVMVCFIVFEFILLENFVQNQSNTSELINISGSQRMKSQRIALFAERLADAKKPSEQARMRQALEKMINDFEKTHAKLTDKESIFGIVLYQNKEIFDIYFAEPIQLDSNIKKYINDARSIIAQSETASMNRQLIDHFVDESSVMILRDINSAVEAYVEQDKHKMLQLHTVSIVFLLTTLAFLSLVSAMVFRPMVHNISNTISMMRLLKSVATAANESSNVEEGLKTAIESICEYTAWPVGHAFIHSKSTDLLTSTDVWFMRDEEKYQPFRNASVVKTFKSGEGFVGEVFKDATPMWILNLNKSNSYLRKEAAAAAGLNAGFAFPIFIGKNAVAVLEFYAEKADVPDESFLSVMSNIGKQLGQTIERASFQERAQLLETVIASANDGIIITKAELDYPGPEIVYVNDAITKITGYQPHELIGKCPRMLQGEFTKQETTSEISSALREGRPFKGELLNYNKNHEPYWLDISIVPVRDAKGTVTHYAAIERDISKQKSAENEFKETMIQLKRANMKAEAAARDLQDSLRKAEEANKAKSDFLANMSHELRTPMNGVLGMAQLMQDTEMSSEQQSYVSTINGSAETLLMLLNDILDFSKIEAGALELERIPFDILECIQSTSSLIKPVADKKQIQLIVDNGLDISPFIMGDSGRMRQIITNLVGNAIKFTEHGYVRVVSRLQEDAHQTLLSISVEDTGMGIPQEKLASIFDKFTQGDASITRKYGGTGLGLAITKQLVSLMGGSIGVNSVEGKGSTFWLTLPYQPATEEDITMHINKKEASKQNIKQLMPIQIAKALLVEDYPVNQVFAEKLLRKFGFEHIDLAENGAQAMVKYRHAHYDVIFMDCQMPEMDGYQTTENIRALEANTPIHTPIVAMTANAMMGDREKCLKAGMDDYVSKPLRAEHLKTILQTMFVLEDKKAMVTTPKTEQQEVVDENNPPVDLEQLGLFTDGDKAEERALFDLFLSQAEEMLVILEQSTKESDKEKWKSAAHRFKGASGNLGAVHIYQLCKYAEKHFEEDEAKKKETLTSLHYETNRVRKFADSHTA